MIRTIFHVNTKPKLHALKQLITNFTKVDVCFNSKAIIISGNIELHLEQMTNKCKQALMTTRRTIRKT